jgi:hypothetical protein
MLQQTRREFFTDVSRGVLVAGLGAGVAADLGLAPAWAGDGGERLTFGSLEPLVDLMQETPADKLQPLLAKRLKDGTSVKDLVAAAALANARAFGGEDYTGFHTMMAFGPAYAMSKEMPKEQQALPVLKVIHRNARRIHETSSNKKDVLHPITPERVPTEKKNGQTILEAAHRKDMADAERTFAALCQGKPDDALNELLLAVQDCLEVHRVVLPYRAWDLVGLIGQEHAHTLLRQSVHYCVKNDQPKYREHFDGARALLPKLLDQFHLLEKPLGKREADDQWVEKMSRTLFNSTPSQASEAVAAALGEGMSAAAIAEAISVAANQLTLRDNGRPSSNDPKKPIGSCHGDSIGVHACDSQNAWRNLARVANQRNTVACLILGAWQLAMDRTDRGGDFLHWAPYPRPEHLEQIKATDPAALLREAEDAIRHNDQGRASAAVQRLGEMGHSERPVFDLLLRYAVSEDGCLHAEKYYRTCSEEFANTRAAFRWRQLTALARVTASAYGQPAPGYEEACRLVRV